MAPFSVEALGVEFWGLKFGASGFEIGFLNFAARRLDLKVGI